ncbi:dephospho-CoA kinase, partial [Bifidobacterium pseudocatenulatum]
MAVVVIRIGLTGGIAAGKSTVSARLRELGAVLVDYDLLARQVVEPGSIGLQRIVECFGSDALTDRG